MRKCWLIPILTALLCCVSGVVLAAEATELADALPRRFKGVYKWNDRKFGSDVVIKFTSVSAGNGLVWAEGEGRHVEDDFRTDVGIEMVIDPQTRAVEMWEKSPEGTRSNPKFTINGSYRGEIAPDLKTIRAVWTTSATGRKGALILSAH